MASKDSIGGLWLKTAKTGQKYMSGTVKQTNGQDLQIVIFKNDKGDNEKRPDYRIYLSEPKEGQGEAQRPEEARGYSKQPQSPPMARETKPDDLAQARRERDGVPPASDEFVDSIPF